jgi:adenylate kinase family enzyme
MRKVAVFGNAGGGKSTLSRRLAELTGLPLFPLEIIQFREGRFWPGEKDGGKISHEEYLNIHKDILDRDEWIVDGHDNVASAWARFAAADTLIYIDLPLVTHYARVTRRFIKGLLRNPEGWPENSPIWSSTMSGYKVILLCHRHLTPKYRQLVADASSAKRVHHLKSPSAMTTFLRTVEREYRSS